MRRILPRPLALCVTASTLAALVATAGPAAAAGPGFGPLHRVADSAAAHEGGTSRLAGQPAVAPSPVTAPVLPAGGPAAANALRGRFEAALAGSGARTVAVAVDVAGYGGLVRDDAAHALPPASTQKAFTAVSALLALGPDSRLTTEVAATAVRQGGTLPGSVWLVGGGDPFLSGSGLAALARSVRAAGVTTIAGDVRLDDSRYDARRAGPGWPGSYVPTYSGSLSALAVDHNSWRGDAAFLADPALPAAGRFRDELRKAGVSVTGTVRRDARPVAATTLAALPSDTMATMVRNTLKVSDNFAAEMLLKEVGHSVRGDGSSAGGIGASSDVLGAVGVRPGSAVDGSGLSALDRQSPAGEVALLEAASASPIAAAFRAALPLGCRDGTLASRYCNTPASGKVSAKTGTLTGVRALAGYTRTASGRDVVFAFQLSGVGDGAQALRAMDRAVVVLASGTE